MVLSSFRHSVQVAFRKGARRSTSPVEKAASSSCRYARVNANAPAWSADETKGVAEGMGAAAGLADEATGGGGAAPFCSPPQLTVRRRAARRNTLRRTIN